jgi:hypothetical protein
MNTHFTNAAPSAPASSPARPAQPIFPPIVWQKTRGYMPRSDLNRYKAELQAASLGVAPVYPPAPVPDPLVPLKAVCAELGVGRRTGRRVRESQITAAEPKGVAAE